MGGVRWNDKHVYPIPLCFYFNYFKLQIIGSPGMCQSPHFNYIIHNLVLFFFGVACEEGSEGEEVPASSPNALISCSKSLFGLHVFCPALVLSPVVSAVCLGGGIYFKPSAVVPRMPSLTRAGGRPTVRHPCG